MYPWDLEGKRITGRYLDQCDVSGVVTLSRVKLGGVVAHYVDLDHPVKVFKSTRDKVILVHSDINSVEEV